VSDIKENKQPDKQQGRQQGRQPEKEENKDNWMEEFLETSQNLVFLAGKDGKVLYANRAGDSLLGEWGL